MRDSASKRGIATNSNSLPPRLHSTETNVFSLSSLFSDFFHHLWKIHFWLLLLLAKADFLSKLQARLPPPPPPHTHKIIRILLQLFKGCIRIFFNRLYETKRRDSISHIK